MSTVNSDETLVNASPAQVNDWVLKQASKADMTDNAARLRVTAINQFAELIAEDEPKDVGWMLKNIDKLTERWARRNQGAKADTAKTYATRVRTTVQEYIKWSAAPHEYDPKRSIPKKEKDDAPKKPKATSVATPEPNIATAQQAQAEQPKREPVTASAEHMDRIRLGGGRDLFFLAPKDGLYIKDAIRSAYALIIACEDYDPSLTPMQVMAQALNGGA